MNERLQKIDAETSLPFKVIAPLMLAIISATVWIQATLGQIRDEQRAAISRAEVVQWRNLFAEQNRNLNVPYIPPK